MNYGKTVKAITKDHKPIDEDEKIRIEKNGGEIYQYYIILT